jgi:squalene-hopene/tetraprenyl-beta-curcumene cyclase
MIAFPCSFFTVAWLLLGSTLAIAQDTDIDAAAVQKSVQRGIDFLRTSQAEDGTFSAKAGPGITALALTAALRCGEPIDSPMITKGLAALEKNVKPDGGIYGNGRLKNYETCISILCFVEANKDGKYDTILKNAKSFITSIQYGVANATDPNDPWNGGVGYGGDGRPDLSNTAYMIEALKALDASADDPAIQRALAFVSKCQNFKNQYNETVIADKVNDGGFFYEIPKTKVDAGNANERRTENGGLRSYGSMTYSGFKSMLYAGLTESDPRVKAAREWIQQYYSVDQNPGMGQAGLYYYYHTFSAALEAAGQSTLVDEKGASHDWRKELIAALIKRQGEDGSWSNENERWFENDKNLATSFSLLSLAKCLNEKATPGK